MQYNEISIIMETILASSELPYWNIFETASDGILIVDPDSGRILLSNPAAADMHGYSPEAFGALRIQTLIQPKSRPMLTNYAQIIRRGALFEMLAQHVRRDETSISVEWRATACNYQEHVYSLVILRDVSKRVHAEQQLQQRMQLRAHEQITLLEISQTLASTLALQPELILEQLGKLIEYTHASLFILKDSTLVTMATQGIAHPESEPPLRIHLNNKKVLETLFNGQRPIRIADISSNEPSAKFLHTLMGKSTVSLLENAQSWMWLPLAVKKRIVGGIGVTHTERNAFTPHHADLAMTIANQAALTLVNAELYERAQVLAAVQERQRLAQNLHDAVNQSLFSAGLITDVLPRLWQKNPAEAQLALKNLRHLIRGALAEMRTLLAELRPVTLIDTELGDLLHLLGSAFTGRTNIPVIVTIVNEGNLPSETQIAIYRICQEALNNIAKHAKANRVEININYTAKSMELSIIDNGRGFISNELIPPGHYGLIMMRECAEAVGAKLTIASQPGMGTTITIQWKKQDTI